MMLFQFPSSGLKTLEAPTCCLLKHFLLEHEAAMQEVPLLWNTAWRGSHVATLLSSWTQHSFYHVSETVLDPPNQLMCQLNTHLEITKGSSVQSLCRVRLCNPMNHSMPGLSVHHQLPEFTQTHVHWVSDAIQPSHPLSSPSPPALNLSQHQGLCKWASSSHQVSSSVQFSC